MRGRRQRLVAYDEAAIIADYAADMAVNAICERHGVGLTRLYGILDRHQIPRKRPTAPRIDNRRRRRILDDYKRGLPTKEIARRQKVSHGTVSAIAVKAGIARVHVREHDELVDLIVRWFVGEEISEEERHAITRVGVRSVHPGLRSLTDVDEAIARDVRRRLGERLLEE